MGEVESYKVVLNGPAPWGFRLQGGKDFSMPLSISRLTPGGKAAQAGVGVGDWVLSIDGELTSPMTHIEAQNRIRACGDRLCLTLSRIPNAVGKQQKDSLPCSEPPKYNFAPSTALNKTARPFGASSPPNAPPGPVTKPVTYVPPAPACTPQHNGHPLRPPSPPGLLPCDPSKLRLIEDTEDWRPRTGTMQSRTFRILARLTGTDCMDDDDDELVNKSSQVPVPDSSSGAAMKTEPGLGKWEISSGASTPGGRQGKGWCWGALLAALWDAETPCVCAAPRTPTSPASRPPWAVDATFAERYAPDKTSTVLSKHSQPATPTPAQNRSSIVQAAQQAPEGPGRTPLCYKCNKVIRGRYLVALGHYYHPEEFVCCQCRKVLDEGGFFEEKGTIFCPKCYDSRYAPSCAKCKKKITGEVMHALKMTWHVQCFTCAACKAPIRNRAFYMEEGQPYCERDYEKMFGTKCRGCDFKIDAGDRFLEALGFSWHDTCFVCAICQTNLEGKTFYSKKDKPLCKSHAFSHV
ncbi:PDZ and LIM domain protein 7 [Eudromia elegans]